MTRWFLVRHGETEWNRDGRIQGHSDVPMSDTGHEQARRTAERLAHVAFSAAYASDLSRARETAEIILARNSAPPPLRVDTALRELSFGLLEGRTMKEISATHPRVAERFEGIDRDLAMAPAEGESLLDAFARQRDFLRRASAQEGSVLVAGHGGTLRVLALLLLGFDPDYYWCFRGLGSASISVLSDERGQMAIYAWNETGHLGNLAHHAS